MRKLNPGKESSPEARLALFIARWALHNQGSLEIKNLLMQEHIEWEKFNRLIAYHELPTFTYICLKAHPSLLPFEEFELLKKTYHFCLIRLSRLWQEFMQMVDVFHNKNIEFLPLKGAAFMVDNMYADRGYLRPMCDIDILVREREFPLAEKIIEILGYKRVLLGMKEDYWKKKNYHIVFIKKIRTGVSSELEIHWLLDYKRKRPLLPYLWNRVRKSQVDRKDIYLLSPEDTLFSLALHQRRFSKVLSLKTACDVALLLDKYNTKFDWDYILKEAKRGQMRTTLYFKIVQANLLFDTQIPSFVLRALGIPKYKKRLIEQFILRNTFASGLDSYNGKGKININNNIYLKSHFIIYDNFWEPVRSILNIPQEQFAKFYRLQPYATQTNLFYRLRFFYFLNNLFVIILKTVEKKLSNFF